MRRIFTADEALAKGITYRALDWSVRAGRRVRVCHGVYAEGPEPPTLLEKSIGGALATGGAVSGNAAGLLLGYDSVRILRPEFTVPTTASNSRERAGRRDLSDDEVVLVHDVRVTSGLRTLLDLAADLDPLRWEQALESALFRRLATINAIEAALPAMSQSRTKGVRLIRDVLALRPPNAPPTESLLETLMVQLARRVGAPVPTRQVEVYDEYGVFVARVDLAWPALGVFLELDGQQHAGQPVYDANRETRVVAATGWLCGRFSWREVHDTPNDAGRRLLRVLAQAERRPFRAS
ncbi:MAG: DUF559 domain-containing protein [Actinobacteria bacterium]|nr:DUF559 domain-containing protein [Actinomycetota bacterium]